jgi:gas vesicle protein
MSDALIGVVVGGLIAALVQFVTAWTGEKRWQFELRLSHLKAERGRLEQIFEESLTSFGEGMANNSYPSNMIADFSLLMPKSVKDKFFEIMDEKDKSIERIRQCYLDMAIEMKSELAEIDKKIEELVGK